MSKKNNIERWKWILIFVIGMMFWWSLISRKLSSTSEYINDFFSRLEKKYFRMEEISNLLWKEYYDKSILTGNEEIMIENHPAEITVDRIIGDVADAFDVTAEDILSKNRQAKISLARKITIYVMKNVKGMTFTQIGEALNKNHSTMTIHYNEIDQLLNTNKALKDNVDDIIKNLRSN